MNIYIWRLDSQNCIEINSVISLSIDDGILTITGKRNTISVALLNVYRILIEP